MKNTLRSLLVLGLPLVITVNAFCAEKPKSQEKSKMTSTTSGAPYATAPSTMDYQTTRIDRLGFGVATFHNIGGTGTALSTWADLNALSSLQGVLTLAGTSPFEFGLGGFYRYTVAGTRAEGFHLGGGAHFGQYANGRGTNHFYASIAPIAGFHLSIPNLSNILISFDGAATLHIYDGDTSFSIRGLSPGLGVAVHYFL